MPVIRTEKGSEAGMKSPEDAVAAPGTPRPATPAKRPVSADLPSEALEACWKRSADAVMVHVLLPAQLVERWHG